MCIFISFGCTGITRHPVLTGFFVWGCANLIGRAHPAEFLFWAGMTAFSVVGALHQDSRMWETRPEIMMKRTSLVPFGAILEGKQSIHQTIEELKPGPLLMLLILSGLVTKGPGGVRKLMAALARRKRTKMNQKEKEKQMF